jgi:hypothetical protein
MVRNFMRTVRNGQSPAHFFDQQRALSVRTICNVSTPADSEILVEVIRFHFFLIYSWNYWTSRQTANALNA